MAGNVIWFKKANKRIFHMNRIVHICFSECLAGTIRHAIKRGLIKGNKIICLIDDLANGSIENFNYINLTIEWNKKIFPDNCNLMIDNIKDNYTWLFKEISGIKDQDIYIWYAQNGKEISGMLYILSFFKNKTESIYSINASEKIIENGTIIKHTCTDEILSDRLDWFIVKRQKIDKAQYSALVDLWTNLQKENSDLRVVIDGKIVNVEVSYYDEMILKNTNMYFSKCIETVGACIVKSESYISDLFLFWRIIELIKSEKIEFRGKSGVISDMEIRKP
jgi:hypothetical protein